ncbi:MAG: YicC/YloC family endoribonuclease [Tatlockia sp.]|jgi:uncharacterized protein (TIGR00255 family)
MIQSMTAFARAQTQLDAGTFCWEIRSVNHRYLDVSFRLPEAFRFMENALRAMLRDTVSRGKLECQLKFQDFAGSASSVSINQPLVDKLLEIGAQLALEKKVVNNLAVTDLLAWPGVIQVAQPDMEKASADIKALFETALTELVNMRKTEGSALKTHIESRLQQLNQVVLEAKKEVHASMAQMKTKLLARLHALHLEVDNGRVEQEIALLLTRLDVSEELDRLQTHALEVAKALQDRKASGRRLDFLMQELNREANTLSAKSDSVALTQNAVDIKVFIEQMREQIQNIE